jgi:hypothetical protein
MPPDNWKLKNSCDRQSIKKKMKKKICPPNFYRSIKFNKLDFYSKLFWDFRPLKSHVDSNWKYNLLIITEIACN